MSVEPVLAIHDFGLEFPTYRGPVQALCGVSVEVAPGEIVALVGESGSGKSVAAMAAIRLLPPKLVKVTGGSIVLVGRDILAEPARSIGELRGKLVSMVFQEPTSALNPTIRIGQQIGEVLRRHESMDRARARDHSLELLSEMQVSDPERVMRSYPFELSGGMRQRVLIAMAFACNPQLLIADEPTTALDVTVQAQVLALIRERARARGTAVLFITHDLAVVSQLCTRIYVLYAGQIVESGGTEEVLRRPRHPYTRALLRSLPECAVPGTTLHSISGTVPNLLHPPSGCRFRSRCDRSEDRCAEAPPFLALDPPPRAHGAACWFAAPSGEFSAETSRPAPVPPDPPPRSADPSRAAPSLVSIEGVEARFPLAKNWFGRPAMTVHALNGVDLNIRRGETLAIVGESGCGKSTLAQLVMALLQPTAGRILFDGADLNALPGEQLRNTRRRLQMVFQDPQGSLDPRMPAWQIIAEPLRVARRLRSAALRRRAAELAELVGIREEQLERYPHEFSGGQRQRLAIARALALEPELLVLDEPTSALDVSIQAQILNLLMQLQTRLQLTYLFISHNVAVVRHVADRVAVMYLGQIVEIGPAALILDHPRHPYTRQLIEAVPRLHHAPKAPPLRREEPDTIGEPRAAGGDRAVGERRAVGKPGVAGEPLSNLSLPTGCFFRSRCGSSNDGCSTAQALRASGEGREVRCHRALDIEGAIAL